VRGDVCAVRRSYSTSVRLNAPPTPDPPKPETHVEQEKEENRRINSNQCCPVYVGASEIASLISLNPHTSAGDAIERLWEKNNRKTFREALARNKLQSFTPQERLKDLGVLELATAVVDAEDTKTYNEKLDETLRQVLTAQDQKVVQDFVNTSRGTKHEKVTFEHLKQTRPSSKFESDATRYQQSIQIPNSLMEYIITGYIDGVETNNKRIIEIKNRQRRFLNHVPLYEQVQCQAYLFLTGLQVCEHTESFRGEVKTTTLRYEPSFWNQVIAKLNKVILRFGDLLLDVSLQDKFLQTRLSLEGRSKKTRSRNKTIQGRSMIYRTEETTAYQEESRK
jgi:hypothetical protein